MPKKIKKCFYEKLTFEKMLEAHKRARKKKPYSSEVIKFEFNLENNIMNMINKIQKHNYHLGKYRAFTIFEPKERIIKSLPYCDRVVQQWYVEEFIKPYIIPKFIHTSFACIKERGTHSAVDKIQQYMKEYQRNFGEFWILKCDIRKFFYNIDIKILYQILNKYIKDKDLIEFTKIILFESREEESFIGIPIGNYTSQFFANIYLNELDHYVKRTLKQKYYVRYMDDFILLCETKQECIEVKKKIEEFIKEKLHLSLNEKSRYYPSKMGINFCGYRTFTTHRLLRRSNKTKMKRNIKKWNKLYDKKILNIDYAIQSINAWRGHIIHSNSYLLQKRMLDKCNFLYGKKAYQKIEQDLIENIENNRQKIENY